ncbi:hypothetical protein OTU49_003182 [Cherax quadricarinatus]|uniref:Uncharacterized protein n=1 Tax=Cherax quadricarinatus TaxID=27406 RepID=A0AAW0XHA8_CHEQU
MDLQEFTVLDEVGDEDAQVRNVDTHFKPSTAAEEIDYLNKILADIEKNAGSCKKYPGSGNNIEGQSLENNNSSDCNLLSDGNREGTVNMQQNSFENGSHDELKPNSHASAEKKCGCDFDEQGAGSDNENKYIFQVKRCISQGFDMPHADDDVTQGYHVSTSNTDSGLLQSGLSTEPNLMTADPVTKSDSNSTQNINACHSNRDADLGEDLEYNIGPISLAVLNESGSSELRPITTDGTTAVPINTSDCRSPVLESQHYSARDTSNNYLSGEDVSGLTDAKNSANDLKFDSVIPGNTGNPLENSQEPGFAIQSTESDLFQIKIDLALVKTEPVTVDPAEEFEFVGFMSDPAEDFRVKEEYKLEEEPTDFSSAIFDQSVDLFPVKIFKSEDEFQNEPHIVHSVRFLVEDKHYSREQVTSAHFISQSSLAPVIDMNMFQNVGKTTLALNLISLEDLIHSPSQVRLEDVEILSLFVKNYGSSFSEWKKIFKYKTNKRKLAGPRRRASKKNSPKRKKSRRTEACVKSLHLNEAGDSLYCNNDGSDSREKKYMEVLSNEKNKKKKKRRHKSHTKQNKQIAKTEENLVKENLDDIKLVALYQDNSCASTGLAKVSDFGGIQKQQVLPKEKDVEKMETESRHSQCDTSSIEDYEVEAKPVNKLVLKAEENWVKVDADDIKLKSYIKVFSQGNDNSCDSVGLGEESHCIGTQKQELHDQKNVHVQETNTESPSHCEVLLNDNFIKVEAKSDIITVPIISEEIIEDSVRKKYNSHQLMNAEAEKNLVKQNSDDIKLEAVLHHDTDKSCDSTGLDNGSECDKTQELHNQKDVQKTDTQSPSHCAILPNEGKFIRGEVKSGVSNMTISPQWTMDNSLTSNFLDVPVTEENILEKSGDMPCITQKHVEPPEKKAKKEIGRIILNDCKPCTVSLLDIAKDKKYKNIVEKYLKLLCKEIKSLTLPDLVKCEDKQIFACKSSDLPTSLRTDRALNIQLASKFTELDDHHKGEDENTMKSSSCSNRIVESEDEPVHVEEEEGYNMGSNSDHNIDKSVELVTANESESLKPGEEHTDYNQDSCNSLVQEEFEKEKVYGNEIFTAASEKRGDCDKDNIYYVDKSLKSEVETSVVGDENREEKIKTPKDAIDKELKLINKDKTQGKMESTREERDKLKRREKKKSKQERTFEINTKKEPEDFKRIKREKTRVTENKMYCHTKWKQEKIREKEKKLKELEQKRKFAVHHGFSKLETIENDSISKENVAAACTSLPSITTFKIPKKKVVETRGSDGDKQNLVLSRRKEILGPGKVSSYYSHKTSGNDDKNRSFSREWNSYRKIDNRNPNKNALETGVQTKQQIIEKWTKWEASHISGRNTVVRGSPAAACSFNDNPGYGLKRLQHMPQMEQKKKIPYQVSSSPVMDKQCMMSDYSAVRPEGRDLNMSNSLISENQKAQCKPERKPETNVLLNVPPPPIVDNWGMMPSRNDVEITDDILYAGEFSPAESSASPQESCHGIKEPEPLEKNIEPNVLSDNKNVSSDVREIKSSLAGNENAQKGPNDTNSTSVSGNKQIDNGTTVDKIRDVITVVNTVEERCRHLDKKQKMRLYEKVKRFYYEAKKRYHEEKGEKKQMKYVEYEKRKKEYYDLKIYLYEEKKREYEANKKNQKENLSKSRNVRQSSKPKEKGSKQILEPVSTLKTKTPQDNTEDIGCANSEKEDPYSPTGSPILLDPEFSDINVRASLLDQTLPFVKKPSFLEQSKQENEIKGTPADDSNELKHTSAPQTTGVNLSGSAPHKNYLPANGMSLGATSNSNITKLYDKVPGIPVLPSKSSVVVPPHDKSMPSASLFPSPLVQNALPLPVPPPQPSSSHSSFPPQPLSKFTSPVQNTQARLTVSTTSSFPNVCGAPVSPSVNTALLLPATPCDRVAAPSSPVVSLPSSSVDTVVPIPCSSAPSEATAQSSKMLSCRYKKSGPSDTPLVSTVIKKQQQLPVDLVPPPLPPDKLFALVGYNLAVSEGEQNSTLDDTLEVPMDIESDSEICNNEGNDTEYLATFGICVDNPSVNEPQVCQTHAANSNKTGKSLKKVLIKLMETTKEKKLVKSSHRNKKEHEQKQEVKEVISNASENSHASTATAGSQVIIPETSDSSNCLEINEEAVDASDIKVNIKETPKKLFCVDELLMSVEAADQQSELQVVFSNVQKSCSNKMLFRDEVPKYYQKTPLAQTLVDKCRGIPLVGLQYVLEVRQDVDMTLDGCYYICVICSKKMNTHTLIPHVKSVHHKLKFSEIHCRDIFLKYGSYSIKQWTAVLVKEFTIALSKVEAKMGRHKLAVAYEKDLSSVLTALKNKITEMSKLRKRSRSSPPKEESMHVYTGSRKRRQSKSPISPSNSRSASHSKGLPTHHRSNSQSQSRYRSRSRSRSRHRSPYRRNDRRPQQSPLRSKEAPREQNKLTTEAKLKAFKDSETRLRAQHTNKQVLYDKQPEAHPDYNREWKIFWERRCGELEEKGIDAFSHDFKSEWAIFWRQRIKELMTNEFKSRRYSLLRKFNMDDPDLELRKNFDSHKTDTKVNSSWSPVRKDTASRIDRSPSPWEDERVSKSAKNPSPPKEVNNTQVDPPNTYEEEFSVIGTLKLLNELEDQLGSFGPAITILLDKAIEKTQNGGDAMDLFSDPDNFVLVRYAREKLSSQVSARILGVSVLVRTQMAVERAMWLQSEAEKFANKEKYLGLDITSIARATLGKDKIQVAQYIAQHLLNVGNSNASEEDLQNILIAVSATHAKIFIEQATKQAQDTPSNVSQPIYSSVSEPVHSSAAESVHNSVEPACTSVEPVCGSFTEPVCGSVADSPLREKPQKFSTLSDTSRSNKSLFPSAMSSNHTSSTSSGHDSSSKSLGLSMLQSAYEDETAKDMEKLSLEDLRSLLANFRSLSPEEQQALTTYLKKLEATDSNKVMKLREEMQKSAKSAGKKIMTPSNANNSQKQSNELSRDSVASKDIQHPVTNPPANRNAETISTRQTKSSMQNEPIIYNPLVKTGFSDSYPPENLHRAEPEREKPPTYQGSSKSPVGLTEAFREFESSHNQTADSQNRMSFVGRPCTARDGSSFTSSSRYAQQRFSESFDKDFYGSDYNKHFGQGGSHSSIPEGPEGLPRYNKPGVQDLPNYTPVHDRGYPSRGNQFQNNFNEQGEKNWYDGRPPPFGPPGQIQQSGYDNSHRKRPPLGGPHGPHVPFQQPW